MSFEPGSALAVEPPEEIILTGPADAVGWARTIPDFGLMPEVYVLFLSAGRRLRRAVWLPPEVTLDDLSDWPDLLLGYAPAQAVSEVVVLVARPEEGCEPTVADAETWELMRLAHDARGLPLADIVLVDGRAWHSLAETLD